MTDHCCYCYYCCHYFTLLIITLTVFITFVLIESLMKWPKCILFVCVFCLIARSQCRLEFSFVTLLLLYACMCINVCACIPYSFKSKHTFRLLAYFSPASPIYRCIPATAGLLLACSSASAFGNSIASVDWHIHRTSLCVCVCIWLIIIDWPFWQTSVALPIFDMQLLWQQTRAQKEKSQAYHTVIWVTLHATHFSCIWQGSAFTLPHKFLLFFAFIIELSMEKRFYCFQ